MSQAPPDLALLGWSRFFAQNLGPNDGGLVAARVASEQRNSYLLITAREPAPAYVATCSGRVFHEAKGSGDLPAVGDFVLAKIRAKEHKATVERVLPRRTKLARPRRNGWQILASNVDTALICCGLDSPFSLSRFERYLTLVGASGVQPVALLTKADLVRPEAADAVKMQIQAQAPHLPVHVLSALDAATLEQLSPYLLPGHTLVALGPSGVGKSTLTNLLADADIQAMMEVRAFDNKGRHCTTSRALIPLPGGAMIIDTPGLRGLGVMDAEGLAQAFADITGLEMKCRFTNCRHENEPGCAVLPAVTSGALELARLESYRRLKDEAQAEAARLSTLAFQQERRRDRRSRYARQQEPDRH